MATQPQITEPEVKQPEVDPETGKFIYMYQPRDAEGQFLGKPYKYLYTDHQDLIEQLQKGKELGDRFIYEVKTGKRKLVGEPALPAQEFKAAPDAIAEEDKRRREEFRKTVKEEFGADPEIVRETFKKANKLDEYILANTWALQNEANGYYLCQKNAEKMNGYLTEHKLRLTAANLDLAFEELKDTLVPKPQEPPVVTADSTQQPPTRAEVKPQSTGIIPGQFAGTRQPNKTEKQPLTKDRFRQIDKMSRDQFNQLKRSNRAEYDAFILMKLPTQPQR